MAKEIIIDYRKVKKYGSKEWEAMKEFQEQNKGKVSRWRAIDGLWYESKKGRLYVDGLPVSKWEGWGLGQGVTYYRAGRSKYQRKDIGTNKGFYEGRLKEILKPFVIPTLIP